MRKIPIKLPYYRYLVLSETDVLGTKDPSDPLERQASVCCYGYLGWRKNHCWRLLKTLRWNWKAVVPASAHFKLMGVWDFILCWWVEAFSADALHTVLNSVRLCASFVLSVGTNVMLASWSVNHLWLVCWKPLRKAVLIMNSCAAITVKSRHWFKEWRVLPLGGVMKLPGH